MALATTACRTNFPEFTLPTWSGKHSFYACDDTSYFLGIEPEGPISAIVVVSCTVTYTAEEIIANVQSPINFLDSRQIPESEYPEGFVVLRIPDPGNRKVFVQLNNLDKQQVPFVGAMKFPRKNECEPDGVFQ